MKPFRTMLFAADLSKSSTETFRMACSLAVEKKTRLFVLHVEPNYGRNEPADRAELGVECESRQPVDTCREAQLQHMREMYIPGHPINVEYCQREGDAAKEILRMAGEIGADLIVLGTHGATPLRRLLVGSVASAVLRGARCPLMALRLTDHSSTADKIRVIVHPTDFSHCSSAALGVARELARDRGARLVLLHVAPFHNLILEGGMTTELDVSYLRNALIAERESTDGPDLKFPVEIRFSEGDASEEIVHVAKEIGCDLIVMGTHGRTGLGRFLMGSTAESILTKAGCPVIVVKASQEESSTASKAGVRQTGGLRHPNPVF